MTRLLGLDLGTRRIGLALAEPHDIRAIPLGTLARGRSAAEDAERVAAVAAANGATELVVGLPLDMRGSEGPAAEAARAWATEIGSRTGLVLVLRDERLSSEVAAGRVGRPRRGSAGGPPGPARRTRYRARIDAAAAAVILEDELDARRRAAAGPGEAES
ncbi:MAG: Holliday junction resolvase RuvX [Chloroflexi bacterium]|nr:Holliday junction resolvase RuvX [Chloroflexota bacterium]